MTERQWHLDYSFPKPLFGNNWPVESDAYLNALFEYLDKSNGPVLSMLPPGVTPAGAAIAASFYFLPGLKDAPEPHCRIALYPGRHFVRNIREINFDLKTLYTSTQIARCMQRGTAQLNGPVDRMRKLLQQGSQINDVVYFHWIWRCRRVWTRYNSIEAEDIIPRGYFGHNDNYHATIDTIECENPERVNLALKPYDLLVYCPYYHAVNFNETESDMERAVRIVNGFQADRKLVVARSPYDYWSSQLESAIGETGISFLPLSKISPSWEPLLRFCIVDQIINLQEALELHTAIREVKRGNIADRIVFSELRSVLRYLLIAIDPSQDHEHFEESVARLMVLGQSLGFNEGTPGGRIFSEIKRRTESNSFTTKGACLRSFITHDKNEIWVTKDSDKNTIADLKTELGFDFSIKRVKRSTPVGLRQEGAAVVLTRIDRECDLDLVSYLQKNDFVVMSSWEAVVRGETYPL